MSEAILSMREKQRAEMEREGTVSASSEIKLHFTDGHVSGLDNFTLPLPVAVIDSQKDGNKNNQNSHDTKDGDVVPVEEAREKNR